MGHIVVDMVEQKLLVVEVEEQLVQHILELEQEQKLVGVEVVGQYHKLFGIHIQYLLERVQEGKDRFPLSRHYHQYIQLQVHKELQEGLVELIDQ
jgi:hypothetical protein